MAGSIFTGPLISTGPLIGATTGNTPQEYSGGEFGPDIAYQGLGFPDPRFQINKDRPQKGSIYGHWQCSTACMVDATPQASNTGLTTAGGATNGTPFVNITSSVAGANIAIPFYPWQSSTLTTAIALDFGWGSLNCTANTAAATPSTGTLQYYSVGMWLVVADVGNSGGTIPLITQVTAVGTSTISLSPVPLANNSAAAVGMGNQFNLNTINNLAATATIPYLPGGLGLFLDPRQTCMRGVGITGVSGGSGGNVLVQGWDVYGQPQSEIIAAGAGAGTVWGVKTYKWFNQATPKFTDASHNYTVVTSDTFGFPLRSDYFENMTLYFNGVMSLAAVSTTNAWTVSDQTNPATTSTGDPRGTFQISARGANSTVTSTNYSNGSRRLKLYMEIDPFNMTNANLNNPITLYGVPPV